MPVQFDPMQWPIAWMARAERQHSRNATARLAPLGLHHREFRLMAFLANQNGLSTGELAEQAVLERSTVSKMVERLCREGWVERSPHPDDLRRTVLRLSAQGREKFGEAAVVVSEVFHAYQKDMTPEATSELMAGLQAFYQRVCSYPAQAQGLEPALPAVPAPGSRPPVL